MAEKRRRWNFNRYVSGIEMAEGVAVHALDLAEAAAKAEGLKLRRHMIGRLEFVDNEPCIDECGICEVSRG